MVSWLYGMNIMVEGSSGAKMLSLFWSENRVCEQCRQEKDQGPDGYPRSACTQTHPEVCFINPQAATTQFSRHLNLIVNDSVILDMFFCLESQQSVLIDELQAQYDCWHNETEIWWIYY